MSVSTEISNYDDIIDSRDVIARLDYLGPDIEDVVGDDLDEYNALTALAEEGEGLSDWHYGEVLVRDSYFQRYAEELADDVCYEAMRDLSWPLTCIDWEQAARELQYDYTSIDFGGVTYWARG